MTTYLVNISASVEANQSHENLEYHIKKMLKDNGLVTFNNVDVEVIE